MEQLQNRRKILLDLGKEVSSLMDLVMDLVREGNLNKIEAAILLLRDARKKIVDYYSLDSCFDISKVVSFLDRKRKAIIRKGRKQ